MWSSLFKPNVTACFQLCHESVNVLLAHLIQFASQSLVDGLQVLQIFLFIMHPALNQCSLVLNVAHQLSVINPVQGICRGVVGTISKHGLELRLVCLVQVLPLFELPVDLVQLLDELALLNVQFANAGLPANLEQLHYV